MNSLAVVAAKAALNQARKARNKAQERADMLSMQIFQLYGNQLTHEACKPWEKIMKVQTDTIPWHTNKMNLIHMTLQLKIVL